jgi:hypothetical protein
MIKVLIKLPFALPPGFEPRISESKSDVLPLHQGRLASSSGFEPKQTDSESVMLPLHYKEMVHLAGLEPATSFLSGMYSNQLKYRCMVDLHGIEPCSVG